MGLARSLTTAGFLAVLSLAGAPGCGGDDDDDDDNGDVPDAGGDPDAGSEPDGNPGPVADAAVQSCEPQKGTNLRLELVARGFNQPVFVTAPTGDARLFVVNKNGVISIVRNGAVVEEPFLDIVERVLSAPADNEQGLLGLAFHPGFAENGRFYVFYTGTAEGDDQDIVSEFRVDPSDPDRVDPDSERRILLITDPQGNHNGGMVAFGPDGYLYVGLGDGGGGGDMHGSIGNGQDRTTLLGDFLRIDIDVSTPPYYAIPADNPYAGATDGTREEIFISGVRNPWRWSFDRQTGDLYIGDVGQGAWEEVDVLPAGKQSGVNLGWRVMEGEECYPPGADCEPDGYTLPVAVYPNPGGQTGAAVVGGYVYRGTCFPDIQGWYFYGDYLTEQVWKFRFADGEATEHVEVTADLDEKDELDGLSSFGEDAFGEIYAVSLRSGEVFHIVAGE